MLILVLLVMVGLPCLGFLYIAYFLWLIRKWAIERSKRRWAQLARFAAWLCIAMVVYYPACLWAWHAEVRCILQTQEALGRQVTIGAAQFSYDHQGESIPGRWVGNDPEPMYIGGVGPPRSFAYLDVPPLSTSELEKYWIAYTPVPFHYRWWLIWPRSKRPARCVGRANGGSDCMDEEEFQRGLAEQLAMRQRKAESPGSETK